MKHLKDVRACLALLRALQARDDIEPRQKKAVGRALDEVLKLRRKPPARKQTFRAIRLIAEALVEALFD